MGNGIFSNPDYTASSRVWSVLFVEDEEAIATVAGQIFPHLNCEVTVFQNPVDALCEFQENPGRYDVVVTDQSMPHMSGVELVEQVRHTCPEMPAIVCTGLLDSEELDGVLEAGVSACVTKPYSFQSLATLIDQVAGQRSNGRSE